MEGVSVVELVMDWLDHVEQAVEFYTKAIEARKQQSQGCNGESAKAPPIVEGLAQALAKAGVNNGNQSPLVECVTSIKFWCLGREGEQGKILRNAAYHSLITEVLPAVVRCQQWDAEKDNALRKECLNDILLYHTIEEKDLVQHLEQTYGPTGANPLLEKAVAQRGPRRARLLYRSAVSTSARQAPFGTCRLSCLIHGLLFCPTTNDSSSIVNAAATELLQLVSGHNLHAARITDVLTSMLFDVTAAQSEATNDQVPLGFLNTGLLGEVLEKAGVSQDALRLPVLVSLSTCASASSGSLNPSMWVRVICLLYRCGVVHLEDCFHVADKLLPQQSAGTSTTTDEKKSGEDFVLAIKEYSAKVQLHAHKAYSDTFGALSAASALETAGRRGWHDRKRNRGGDRRGVDGGQATTRLTATEVLAGIPPKPPVLLQFPEPLPRWSSCLSQNSALRGRLLVIEGLISVGGYREAQELLSAAKEEGCNLFLIPARSDTPNLQQVLQRTTMELLAGMEQTLESEDALARLCIFDELLDLLAVVRSFLASTSFLGHFAETLSRMIGSSASIDQRYHNGLILCAQRVLSHVLLPSLRVLPPSPALCNVVDGLVGAIPDYTARQEVFANTSPVEGVHYNPVDEIKETETRALISFCLSRVTPKEASSFASTIQPALYTDPLMVCEKFIQHAIGYDDSSGGTILVLAQLLRNAPPLTVRTMCYVSLSKAWALAQEDRQGSVARVSSACNLIAVVWRQNIENESFDSECVFFAIERALQVEARDNVLFGLSLLKSVYFHFMHEMPDSAEHWSHEQLKSISCGKWVRWYAAGAGESFLSKIDETYTPISVDRNFAMLKRLLAVRSDAPSGVVPDIAKLPSGIRLLLLLCRSHQRVFAAFSDLPGRVEDVLLFTFHQYEMYNDFITITSWLTLTNKALTVSEKELIFRELSVTADAGIAMKLGVRLLPEAGTCVRFAKAHFNLRDGSASLPAGSDEFGVSDVLYEKFWCLRAREVCVTTEKVIDNARAMLDRTYSVMEKKFAADPKQFQVLQKHLTRHSTAITAEWNTYRESRTKWISEHKSKVKDLFGFTPAGELATSVDAFVHLCMIPRARLSHEDALTAANFLTTLVNECSTEASEEERKEKEAVRRWVCRVTQALVTHVLSFFVSFAPGEIKRLGACLSHLIEFFQQTHASKDYPGLYKFWDKTTANEPLVHLEAFLAQSVVQMLSNLGIPSLLHRNAFTVLDKLGSVFPTSQTVTNLLLGAVELHGHKASPCFASASSMTKKYLELKEGKNPAGLGKLTASLADESLLRVLLADEFSAVQLTVESLAAVAQLKAPSEEKAVEGEEEEEGEAEADEDQAALGGTPIPEDVDVDDEPIPDDIESSRASSPTGTGRSMSEESRTATARSDSQASSRSSSSSRSASRERDGDVEVVEEELNTNEAPSSPPPPVDGEEEVMEGERSSKRQRLEGDEGVEAE